MSGDLHSGISFKVGVMFSADNEMARWMTIVCMALNDLMLINGELIPRLEGDDSPDWENVYYGKLAASHLYEIGKFLRESEKRVADVSPFVKRLPEQTQSDYAKVSGLGPHGRSDFAKALHRLRNHFFHYAELVPHAAEHEQLSRALAGHADATGKILVGDRVGDFRAVFADDVAAELALPGDDEDATREFMQELAESVTAFLRFGYEAIQLYINDTPRASYKIFTESSGG